jgi:hypothetical protein
VDGEDLIVQVASLPIRHPGVAISIATASYPGESFGAAVILLVVVQGIVCPLHVRWQRSGPAAAESAPDAGSGPGPDHITSSESP